MAVKNELFSVLVFSPERDGYMEVPVSAFIAQLESYGFPKEQIKEMLMKKLEEQWETEVIFDEELELRRKYILENYFQEEKEEEKEKGAKEAKK
ncbi:MAG: hypothetical protein AB7D08_03535 [Bacteroidales bacterium]